MWKWRKGLVPNGQIRHTSWWPSDCNKNLDSKTTGKQKSTFLQYKVNMNISILTGLLPENKLNKTLHFCPRYQPLISDLLDTDQLQNNIPVSYSMLPPTGYYHILHIYSFWRDLSQSKWECQPVNILFFKIPTSQTRCSKCLHKKHQELHL